MLVMLVAAMMGFVGLCVCVMVMSSSAGADGPTGSTTASYPTAVLPRGKFVQQTFAKPPEPCGWYGCFMGSRSGNVSQGKWADVPGLTEANVDKWPRLSGKTYWNPYATSGREEDGGIVTPRVGDLPTVDPPKDRYKYPYNMDPLWMSGSDDTNNYYKARCTKYVKHRGKLYYQGPSGESGAGTVGGSYIWLVIPQRTPGGGRPAFQFYSESQPAREDARYRVNNYDHALEFLRLGAELPPWYRKGPWAMDKPIRDFCK